MRYPPDKPARTGPAEPDLSDKSILARLKAIIRSEPLINSIVVIGITVGFFHGWLKVQYPSPVTTFLFDAWLGLALALVFLKEKKQAPFIPAGAIGNALKLFYGFCAIYALLPLGPPLIVSMAALRGWCFATLMFSLGYHLTHSVSQIKGYFYVVIILAVITAIYGIRQSPDAVKQKMFEDQMFAQRYGGAYFATEAGSRELRRFSTFISSGAFGGTMAYVIVFSLALLSEPRLQKKEKILIGAAILPMTQGMLLSGARTALLMVLCGLVLTAWYRRRVRDFVVLPLVVFLGIKMATQATSGAFLERYQTLLNWETLIYRPLIPTIIGWNFMMENPLGGGLGKSGYSVPFFLLGRTGYSDFKAADGDLGCLMIEMGIVGLIVFGLLIWRTLTLIRSHLAELRDTPVSSIAIAAATAMLLSILVFPLGSPFLGIPIGALTWFFVGTLQKLAEEFKRGAMTVSELPAEPKARRYLYHRPSAKKTNHWKV